MRIRRALVAFALFAACLCGPAAAADALPVQTLHLDLEGANYVIDIEYPQTGLAAIDHQIAAWVKAQADWLIHDARIADRELPGNPYGIAGGYTVTRNDRQMFEVLFGFETMTGGAHPNDEAYTLNFMRPSGQRVFLAEIVKPAGMAALAKLALANLSADDLNPSRAESIHWAATVRPGMFEAFTLTKTALVLYFEDSEDGTTAEIPLGQLRPIMRADWSVPQPSFDCGKAATAVEKALCADVALARLDRRMAEIYYWLTRGGDDAAKTRTRNEQRAFLRRRDTACAGKTGSALTQCLTGVYQARLKALDTRPD